MIWIYTRDYHNENNAKIEESSDGMFVISV